MEWLTKAWSFIKDHKKKVGAAFAGAIAIAEYLGYTGWASWLAKIFGYLGGGGTPAG